MSVPANVPVRWECGSLGGGGGQSSLGWGTTRGGGVTGASVQQSPQKVCGSCVHHAAGTGGIVKGSTLAGGWGGAACWLLERHTRPVLCTMHVLCPAAREDRLLNCGHIQTLVLTGPWSGEV